MTIRWPWVSRERYDESQESCASLHARIITHLQQQLLDERARYDDLMARFTMLKLQGASEVEPLKPITPKPVDPVMAAFNEAFAGKGPKVRKQGLAQLERDKAAGLSAEQIITRIRRGNRPADEIDDTTTPERTASEA